MSYRPPLRSIALPPGAAAQDGFPFTLPVVRELGTLRFETPVTFFVGENGCGKSTFLEALAWALQCVTAGSQPVDEDPSLEHVRPLGRVLEPVWNRRTRRGFFLRAEDFFGYVKHVQRTTGDLDERAARVREENPHVHAGERDRIAAPYEGSAAALRARYGEDMDARSHGEQFLGFFRSRLVPGGVYLLDEPEAPLSPTRQLALLSLLMQASSGAHASQFLIATHSPILMSLPGAALWSFDEAPIRRVAYDELEHVRLTRDFLNRPEAFLRHL